MVPLAVPALGDLSVSFYLPDAVAAVTEHTEGLQTTYISGQGNFTGVGTLASQTTTHNFYVLSGVDVQVHRQLPNGWQLCTRLQLPGGDRSSDRPLELCVKWSRVFGVYSEACHVPLYYNISTSRTQE